MSFDIILYGGSFNPIHLGHLKIIEILIFEALCDKILLMPTYQSPFKKNEDYIPPEFRMQMLKMAIESYFSKEMQKKIIISDYEVSKNDINYTIDTAKKFLTKRSGILIGSDHLDSLHLWKDISTLLKNYTFIVVPRNSYPQREMQQRIKKIKNHFPDANLMILYNEITPCSSTNIRKRISEKKTFDDLKDCLLLEIYKFIKENHLYEK